MKKLLTAIVTAGIVALSTPVFAEWTKVGESVNGDTWYIDYDTVKENNGYVFYWGMDDYLRI